MTWADTFKCGPSVPFSEQLKMRFDADQRCLQVQTHLECITELFHDRCQLELADFDTETIYKSQLVPIQDYLKENCNKRQHGRKTKRESEKQSHNDKNESKKYVVFFFKTRSKLRFV